MKRRWGAELRTAVVVTVATLLGVGTASVPPAAAHPVDPRARLLTASDLPTGWHAHRATAAPLDFSSTPCLRGLEPQATGEAKAVTATFVQGSGLPALSESLVGGDGSAGLDRAVSALERCHRLTLTVDAKRVHATIAKLTLDVPAATSHAFSLALTASGVPIGADIVLFGAHGLVGQVVYVQVGAPTSTTAAALVGVAISKAEGQAVKPPPIVSVVSSPVKVAHTTKGAVGYREVGSGPPLVMIMGFAGTMETWDPRFVDALAHRHEVVIFDNAGIGHTRALGAPLTIDEMADQTSALIRALHLGAPDVVGWSMGAMVAEALAVLHPSQVGGLVLCAGYPGTGTVRPTQKAIDDLTNGSPAAALADLFPADQHVAAAGYGLALSGWPPSRGAPAGVVAAQEKAITRWWSGADPAGARTSAISVPTLIADGTVDRLDPQANAHRLQALIAGVQLILYPDAGHAFLFQDETVVVPAIDSFLGV